MTPRDLAERLLQLVNQRDLDAAVALLDPEIELCFPRFAPRAVFRGAGELAEFFDWMTAAMPVQTLATGRIVATDSSATIEFEVAGVSARGHAFDNVGAAVLDADRGRIRRLRIYIDTADLGRILEVA